MRLFERRIESPACQRPKFRPLVECFEERVVPAVITVNTNAVSAANPPTVTVDDLSPVVTLADAINAANNTPGADIIQLAPGTTYSFTVPDNYWFGPNALPAIASEITIQGNGATISRSESAVPFRFFCVLGGLEFGSQSTGTLTLENLTLTGGMAKGGNSGVGGGGLGAGGAVFNVGTLHLSSVTISNNSAQGGDSGAGLAKGGGGIGQSAPFNLDNDGTGGGFGGPFPGATGGTGGDGDFTGNHGAGGGGGFSSDGQKAKGSDGGNGGGQTRLGGRGAKHNDSFGGEGGDGGGGGGNDGGGDGGTFGFGGGAFSGSIRTSGIDWQTTLTQYNVGSGGGGVGGGGGGSNGYGATTSAFSGGGGGGFGGGGGTGVGFNFIRGGVGTSTGGEGGFGGGGGGNGGGSVFGGGAGANTGNDFGGGGAGMGGALFNMYGQVTIINSTLANNQAVGGSGGSGNSGYAAGGSGSGLGGSIFNLNGTVTLLYSTLANNTVDYKIYTGTPGLALGSAIYNLGYGYTPKGENTVAAVNIANTILTGNQDPGHSTIPVFFNNKQANPATNAVVHVNGPNIAQNTPVFEGGAYSYGAGEFTIADPQLGALQYNGGSTYTMAPQAGSPALYAGQTGPASQLGNPLIDRANLDLDVGQIYINAEPFDGSNTPAGINFIVPTGVDGHTITPLAFSVADGVYTLAAVYTPVEVMRHGYFGTSLNPVFGSLDAGTTYVLGYTDQVVTATNGSLTAGPANTGTIEFDFVNGGNWLHTQTSINEAVALFPGVSFSAREGGDLFGGRVYSVTFSLSRSVLPYDQRGNGFARVVNGSTDLGAYQTQSGAVIAVGDPEPGRISELNVFDASTGDLNHSYQPFHDFSGGIRTAVADINADGVKDIIAAAGPGGGPHVKVYNGIDGVELANFFAFEQHFTGGIFVAAGDIDGDGYAEFVVGAGAGGGPRVTVFSGKDGSILRNFFAFDSEFTGGVTVGVNDINGDGYWDIVVGAGAGGGPHIKVFSGKDGSVLQNFFAFEYEFTGGIYVSTGDLVDDFRAEVIVGASAGGTPRVQVFTSDRDSVRSFHDFHALEPDFSGGARVGVLNRDGERFILIGAGPGGGPRVRVLMAETLETLHDFFAFPDEYHGGVFVG